MDAVESLRLSWRSIRSHKLRSALSTIGIVIGIAAVITLVTLGTSLQADVLGQFAGRGAPNVYVWAGPPSASGTAGAGAQPVFTQRDLRRLRNLAGVRAVTPRGVIPASAVTYRGDTVSTNGIVATTPGALDGEAFALGRSFRMGEREAVLNPLAANMFDRNVSVGDRITVTRSSGRTVNATVVGILNSSSGSGPFERFSTLPRVYVPTRPYYGVTVRSPTTGERQRVYPLLTVTANGPEQVASVERRVSAYLRNESDASRLKPNSYEFNTRTNEELLDRIRELIDTLTAFVTGIAVVSLVVASIGIANIMLVSVTERTKEIGIMKAVGAQNRDVLQLFLVEATMLGALGAVLGTLAGIAGGYLATEYVGIALVVAVRWIPVAVAVGVLVGVLAGLYPAWNAARVDPIDALRYE